MFDNLETYMLLVGVCRRYDVDPSSSLESEEFFRDLLTQYSGDPSPDSITAWLEERIPNLFTTMTERPRWIQEPKWPFANGKPMIFAGQVDVATENNKVASQLYHDDTSLYVFVGPNARPVVVIQQY